MARRGRIRRLVVQMSVLVCFALYARTANGQSRPAVPTEQSAKERPAELSKELLTENDAKPSAGKRARALIIAGGAGVCEPQLSLDNYRTSLRMRFRCDQIETKMNCITNAS